ncbi:helix-turn-helix domain-containing protein [Zavarzinia compransoris]|uniref:AraC-like ligand-binding domain-containing protein n=1 Tax=Zavarzinia marina TaxID=2911065 RepID=UPI001F1DA369|nr:helix-turn-helix domain-containing protein [Zavarzinia marina]MCF4164590.1 helix-turn-helix domain-containing protein [Zavarzinia marina]
MATTLSTEDVVPQARLGFWADLVCDSYVGLDCRAADPRDFSGSIDLFDLHRARISEAQADAHTLVRSRRQIARSGADDFLLSIQLDGRMVFGMNGQEAPVPPGSFVLYDASREYSLHFPVRTSQVVLQVPRHELARRIGHAEAACGRVISGGGGIHRGVFALLTALPLACRTASAEQIAALEQHALDLLACSLRADLPTGRFELSDPRFAALMLAKTYIDRNLRDPALNRARIAAAVGRSVRDLNRLFAAEGQSVTSYVRNQRLSRCRDDLGNPALSHKGVSQIAFDWGFGDAAHFARCFRARFGQSALDYRRAAPALRS